MTISDRARCPVSWLTHPGESGVVISSRIRLARNFRDRVFPAAAGPTGRHEIWTEASALISRLDPLRGAQCILMDELSDLERGLLFERHLLSREHREGGEGRGLVLREDEQVAVMINEEDHLRMQVFRPGLDVRGAWDAMDRLDSQIEQHMQYAFSAQWGYLTACPSNVGTGLRASAMMHLPALVHLDEMGPIIKGLGKIGLMVRGLWGEGSEAVGHIFQLSNQITLGKSEVQIVELIEKIVREIVEHELNARIRMVEKRKNRFQDMAARAYGILMHARILNSQEALNLLSDLRLGFSAGMVEGVDEGGIQELLLLTQPAHLQIINGRDMDAGERDTVRARHIRNKLKAMKATLKLNETL